MSTAVVLLKWAAAYGLVGFLVYCAAWWRGWEVRRAGVIAALWPVLLAPFVVMELVLTVARMVRDRYQRNGGAQ